MPPTRTLVIYERMVPGLTAQLQKWRADDVPWFQISLRLHDEHGIDVAPSTIQRWLDALDENGAA